MLLLRVPGERVQISVGSSPGAVMVFHASDIFIVRFKAVVTGFKFPIPFDFLVSQSDAYKYFGKFLMKNSSDGKVSKHV